MPADFCGIKPFIGHRFDRVTKYGTDVTEFNSHGAILESCVAKFIFFERFRSRRRSISNVRKP
jgi:hypothetical protein